MKKRTRFAAAAAALMMAAATCGAAAGQGTEVRAEEARGIISPRFDTISSYSADAVADGDEISISAKLTSRKSTSLSISVTVKKDGRTVDTFSSSENGMRVTLAETSPYEKGHSYRVTFTYNAGGERHSVEKSV